MQKFAIEQKKRLVAALRKMKLFVFDLDGTLLDTLSDLTDSVNYALNKLGLPLKTDEQVRRMVGNGIAVTLLKAMGDGKENLLQQAKQFQQEYYNAHCNDKTVPYNGVKRLLAQLKLRGYIVAVYTNKAQAAAEDLCGKQFGTDVDYVIGTISDDETKPSATRLLRLMNKLSVPKQNCVYCGDSDVDIDTARNAGVRCISAAWGFKDKSFLLRYGATDIADSPEQVLSFVK